MRRPRGPSPCPINDGNVEDGTTVESCGARGIRILVVILALTASRNNFPLGGSGPFTDPRPSSFGSLMSPASKRHEGVIPSRRFLESRRADWVRALVLESHRPSPERPALPCLDPMQCPTCRPAETSLLLHGVLTRPAYLCPFSGISSPTSLPPPSPLGVRDVGTRPGA
jgi:hypothetical protein